MYDMTPDDFGIALGLGEEIAMDNQANEMSQKDSDDVLSKPISEDRNLIPVSSFNKDSNVINLSDFNNWMVDFTKRLRSPFVEKWKMVAMGIKTPDAPLLTQSEKYAYEMAQEKVAIDDVMDEKSRNIVVNIQRLKQKRAELEMVEVGKEILKRREQWQKSE